MEHASAEHASGRDQQIRERAYGLWEAGGRQPNRDAEYWHRAADLVTQEEQARPEALPRNTAVQGLDDAERAAPAQQPAEESAASTPAQARKLQKSQGS